MKYRKVLVVTDNVVLFEGFLKIVQELNISESVFTYSCTSVKISNLEPRLRKIDVKQQFPEILKDFDLVFSIHCKQVFPNELVTNLKCINIHPGLNPYNRGWYPQVFSIINGLPIGATIHEMDEQIDHGGIIAQQEVKVEYWDTSLEVYEKVLAAEINLLEKYLPKILDGDYVVQNPTSEGNYNSKSDFGKLQRIDLNETQKVGALIDKLRALSHGEFHNAYFLDPRSGKKVFIKLQLDLE